MAYIFDRLHLTMRGARTRSLQSAERVRLPRHAAHENTNNRRAERIFHEACTHVQPLPNKHLRISKTSSLVMALGGSIIATISIPPNQSSVGSLSKAEACSTKSSKPTRDNITSYKRRALQRRGRPAILPLGKSDYSHLIGGSWAMLSWFAGL
ncbi:hypothetical protein F5882DRAFT_410721 [Hyaloscypha sp. PMI_1271]|nr:hypothetical protein F5882DRAFT_410721 [Hyaloscypha sp. PMI_1271]